MEPIQNQHNPDTTGTQKLHSRPSGLDALQAVLLLTGHLTDVLPLLAATQRVPVDNVARVGLLEGMAKRIAYNRDLVLDFYEAMELLAGRDLSGESVADLILLSKDLLEGPAIGEIGKAAHRLGLIDEDLLAQWVLYDSMRGG